MRFGDSIICSIFQVFHKSEKNISEKPRHAYTFHVIEMQGSDYSKVIINQENKKTFLLKQQIKCLINHVLENTEIKSNIGKTTSDELRNT